MRRFLAPLTLALLAAAASSARAQDEGDDASAPTLIREHGTAAPADGRAARTSAPVRSSKATPPGAKKLAPEPKLDVVVHEGEELVEVERAAVRAYGRSELPSEAATSPEPEIAFERRTQPEPRPPLPELEPSELGRWQRHGELGVSGAWIARPFAAARGETPMSYRPAIGVGIHVQWDIRSWVVVKPYFVWGAHDVELRYGALATTSPNSIRSDTVFQPVQATTFAFGGKLLPTLNLSPRARAWLVAGVGYGRASFRGVTLTEPGSKPLTVPDREGSFIEFPFGFGGSFEILPRRAAIVYEATGAPLVGQSGSAYDVAKVVDGDGRLRELGAFGAFEASFVQTLGLSLIL
ncbi:MAG: hypothetical protein FJ095_12630 [Deltaproteobacteria bacterium]|nr:hypothetical protein [Deltaproteobacteria bacterium]